ncbi:MAG: serine hydrolase, partial [Flavobacteriaceae bacterium]
MGTKVIIPAGPFALERDLRILHDKVLARLETSYKNVTLVTSYKNERKCEGFRGLARKEQDPPKRSMVPIKLMNCASNSKIITAVAVLKVLWSSSKVSLSSPMYKYLPMLWEVHPDVKKITFQDLLSYRSGLKNIKITTGHKIKELL